MADTFEEISIGRGAPGSDPPVESSSKRKLGLGGWICAAWLILMVAVAIFGPLLVTSEAHSSARAPHCGDGSGLPIYPVYDPVNCRDREARDSQADGKGAVGEVTHLTGVDTAGHDTFSQVFIGTRITLLISIVSIGLATLIGGAMGLAAGFFRGKVDVVCTLFFDVMIAFPPLILALLLVLNVAAGVESRKVPAIIVALTVVAIPILGRISRASTLSWADREFVMASRALGAKPFRIIMREVLPNVAPAMMSIAMLGIGIVIVTESSLSIIGLGVPDSAISWGYVVAKGAETFRQFPHLVFVPSVPIVLTVCALNFLGDALRRKFDVRESAL